MDIKNYTSFFHDGSILNITHSGNRMTISMESAEMDEEDLVDDLALSKNNRIKGKLYIEGIKSIKENGEIDLDVYLMKGEYAEIFHFKLHSKKVEFEISWNSSPPSPCIMNFYTVEIEAENIWWENIPDLIYS